MSDGRPSDTQSTNALVTSPPEPLPLVGDASPYAAGAAHYLSSGRRDAVKRLWEEPVNHRILAAAMSALEVPDTRPLRVVDVGAGAGDGLALLHGGLDLIGQSQRLVHYTGVDPDPTMIATGRSLHESRADVEFVQGDARDVEGLGLRGVDLVMSAGVPYSHLTHEEFRGVLGELLAAVGHQERPTAVVIDVLGRFSIEWVSQWSSDRWDYDMTFFHDTDNDATLDSLMSFHSRSSVASAIDDARRLKGLSLAPIRFWDRSVMIGRHTTTQAFNLEVPNYRSMLNRLHEGDVDLDLDQLLFSPPRTGAPNEVLSFFAGLASKWNTAVRRAVGEESSATGASPSSRGALADELRALEHRTQQGLGAAHSLIALVVVNPPAAPVGAVER